MGAVGQFRGGGGRGGEEGEAEFVDLGWTVRAIDDAEFAGVAEAVLHQVELSVSTKAQAKKPSTTDLE